MNQEEEHGWDRGWEEHKLRQMERMARLPFAKKLQWLEEAHFLVISLNKSREKKNIITTMSQALPLWVLNQCQKCRYTFDHVEHRSLPGPKHCDRYFSSRRRGHVWRSAQSALEQGISS